MKVFIGLGSNLADPQTQVLSARQALSALPMTQYITMSSLYKSPPMGPQDQPDYINAVVELETTLTPQVLLKELQAIEQNQGRVKRRHWGERTLDLDILLYGDHQIDESDLHVPHKGIAERAFVLYPLAEIVPNIEIPTHGHIAELLALCPKDNIERLDINKK